MKLIILITFLDEKNTRIVSHGYDIDTDKLVILPQMPLFYFPHEFNREIGEWVLK